MGLKYVRDKVTSFLRDTHIYHEKTDKETDSAWRKKDDKEKEKKIGVTLGRQTNNVVWGKIVEF